MNDACLPGAINMELRSVLAEVGINAETRRGRLQEEKGRSISETEKAWLDEQIAECRRVEDKTMTLIQELWDVPQR